MKTVMLFENIEMIISSTEEQFINKCIDYFSFKEKFRYKYSAKEIDVNLDKIKDLVQFKLRCEKCNKKTILKNALRGQLDENARNILSVGGLLTCDSCFNDTEFPKLREDFDIHQFTEEELSILKILYKNPLSNKAYKILFGDKIDKNSYSYKTFWRSIDILRSHRLVYVEKTNKGQNVKSFKVSPHIVPFLMENEKQNKSKEQELVLLRKENDKLKENVNLMQQKASILEKELGMLRSYMKHYSKIISNLADKKLEEDFHE